MHIGTALQALNVKLSLSCHADYWWIVVTPLRVNETDYNFRKLETIFQGYGIAPALV